METTENNWVSSMDEYFDSIFDNDCKCGVHNDEFEMKPCEICKDKEIKINELENDGRIVGITVCIKKVCPGTKIAVGVILKEGKNIKGFKVKTVRIPGKPGEYCEGVKIKFCFLVEDNNLCECRRFKADVIAHYADISLSRCDCTK